jgi:hypothetical protein
MLEEDGEDQLGRRREIRMITMNKRERNSLHTIKRIKGNQMDFSRLAWGLQCKTH